MLFDNGSMKLFCEYIVAGLHRKFREKGDLYLEYLNIWTKNIFHPAAILDFAARVCPKEEKF